MATIQTFNYQVNLMQAILWQYNEALRLQGLLEQKQAWYNENQTAFWEAWYTNVFNLQTADEFGLSVWAIILDLPLVVEVTPTPSKPNWGYGAFNKNYNNGNFASSSTGAVRLTKEQARLALKLRYLQLIARGTVTETNQFLQYIFGDDGLVYVLDGLDMTMLVVFTFVPSSQLQFVLENYDLIPRPAAVGINYLVLIDNTWAFGEYRENFDNSNFGINS